MGLIILYNLYFKDIEPQAGVYTSIYVFYLDVGLQNLVPTSTKLYNTGFNKLKNSPGFEQFCLEKKLDPKKPPVAYRQITSYSVPFSTPNFLKAVKSQLQIAFNQRGYDSIYAPWYIQYNITGIASSNAVNRTNLMGVSAALSHHKYLIFNI